MNGRWFDRIAAFLSLFLLATLAAVSFYLAERARVADQPLAPRIVNSDPDYFIEGFSITQTDADGKARTRLTAQKAQHRPDIDGFDLVKPISLSLDDNRNFTKSRSDIGQTVNGRATTHLIGNVVIERDDGANAEHLVVKSEKFTMLNEENLAKTDLPVEIQQGASKITGVGAELNTRTRELKVHANVKVFLPARQGTAKPSAPKASAYNAGANHFSPT